MLNRKNYSAEAIMTNLSVELNYENSDSNAKKLKLKIQNSRIEDIDTTYLLGEVCEKIITLDYNNYILDLSSVEHINSSGLGSLMNIQKSALNNKKAVNFIFHQKMKPTITIINFDKMADVLFL